MKKISKQKILMLFLALIVLTLIAVNFLTTGTVADPLNYTPHLYSTAWALFPPAVAIALALMTKEVYSSLFVGIFTGALLYSNFNLELALNTLFYPITDENGASIPSRGVMVHSLGNSGNVGILIFLVILGILVALMNKAGGSTAFGKWASSKIKTREGAQLATVGLGSLIFIDDYFNCLTVGSVMRPVTDKHKVSRAKLAYIIDATAAPVCIIAPISSWAAAVTSSVPEEAGINGFTTFLQTIPCNYYAVFTIIAMLFFIVTKANFGPMKKHEENALRGDLYTTPERPFDESAEAQFNPKGKIIDLVLPVAVLIIACIFTMLYTGGFMDGVDFITAFGDSNASVGLVLGSFIALIFTFFFYLFREVITFNEFMECIPEGFKAMVSPILILTFAWTLSDVTSLLGADVYVADLVGGSASVLQSLLPAIIFLVAVGLAFATGTSWGTFGILIPIVLGVFPAGNMMIVSISACLAGAVCGDHCSPISDTTILASAGARCHHVNHVSTQLPYALLVAAVSFVAYLIAGLTQNGWIGLICGLVVLFITLTVVSKFSKKANAKNTK